MKSIKNLIMHLVVTKSAKKHLVTRPEIVSLPEKKLIGYSIHTSIRNNQKQKDIPPFFHEVYDNNKLAKLNSGNELNMHCVFDMHENNEDFEYYVAVEDKTIKQSNGYATITLPSGIYVKTEFIKKNHKAVGMVLMYLRKFWVGKNGYKERLAPPFILYDERFHSNFRKYGCNGDNYLGKPVSVIYIPVEKQ